jgi:uncharacterized protein (DUF427 family)
VRRHLGRPRPDRPGPGQESVWDYPRPPAVDPSTSHVVVTHAGTVVADTTRSWRVLETSHPPVYYLAREDVRVDLLERSARRTWCEYKGEATYGDLVLEGVRVPQVCWWYDHPVPGYEAIAGAVAFYPQRVERITVDDEVVRSVEGDFYGGWITSLVAGPFKGAPGTEWW